MRQAPSARFSWWKQPERILEGLVLALSVVALALLSFAVSRRIGYPFELEWMEGAVLDHARVMLAGQPLYRAPSVEFTPFIYTPFYYMVCAALFWIFGVSLAVARAVSVVAGAGCLLIIVDFVRRESGDTAAALVAGGLFAATYELTGFWFDVARVDSLFLLLLLLGTWLARFGRSYATALGVALCLMLAFLTKQTGLLLAPPALLFAFSANVRRGLLASAAFVALLVGSVLWLNYASHDWFGYYVFDAPAQHELLWGAWASLLLHYFWWPGAVPLLFSWFALLAPVLRGRGLPVFSGYFALAALGFVAGYSGILHRDGFVNVLMPGYAALSILTGLSYAWIRRQSPRSLQALRSFSASALLVGFAVLSYDVRRALPTDRDVQAGSEMLQALRRVPRPLWSPSSGFIASLAGRSELAANTMGMVDVFKTRETASRARLRDDLLRTIRSKRYAAIIFDRAWDLLPFEFRAELQENYRFERRLFPASMPDACWPRTGFHTRPEELWVPR